MKLLISGIFRAKGKSINYENVSHEEFYNKVALGDDEKKRLEKELRKLLDSFGIFWEMKRIK